MLTLIKEQNYIMTIKDITNYLEELAPLSYAENFDNTGLLVGDYNTKVKGILVTLDTLEETVNEAIEKKCNLIVSFHPIIFKGLKKLNSNSYVERTVLKAIKNDVAIYATHTALDNSKNGVSSKICDVLELINKKVLIPKKGIIRKLTTYIPTNAIEKVRNSLFKAGGGNIGNYDYCSFKIEGKGTFRGNNDSNPVIGEKGVFKEVKEHQISITYETKNERAIINSLFKNHPYEEVAYEITNTENFHQNIGMGMVGELSQEMNEHDFLKYVKEKMKTGCIKHSQLLNKKIKKVAVLGGSGAFAIENAISNNVDAYISADFKYHDFFKAEKKILLLDIGHYESEQFTKNLLVEYLTKKFTNFAIILSEKNTNPIYYL